VSCRAGRVGHRRRPDGRDRRHRGLRRSRDGSVHRPDRRGPGRRRRLRLQGDRPVHPVGHRDQPDGHQGRTDGRRGRTSTATSASSPGWDEASRDGRPEARRCDPGSHPRGRPAVEADGPGRRGRRPGRGRDGGPCPGSTRTGCSPVAVHRAAGHRPGAARDVRGRRCRRAGHPAGPEPGRRAAGAQEAPGRRAARSVRREWPQARTPPAQRAPPVPGQRACADRAWDPAAGPCGPVPASRPPAQARRREPARARRREPARAAVRPQGPPARP
jgi:hypothetical protein